MWAKALLPVTTSACPARLDELLRCRHVEVAGDDVESPLATDLGDVLRDVDADRLDTYVPSGREKDSVVAAELDDSLRMKPSLEPGGVFVEVLDQRRDGARGKRVVLEQDVGIDRIDDLDQSAALTRVDRQRKPLLRRDIRFRAQESPCQWHRAEVEDEREPGVLAGPARRGHERTPLAVAASSPSSRKDLLMSR